MDLKKVNLKFPELPELTDLPEDISVDEYYAFVLKVEKWIKALRSIFQDTWKIGTTDRYIQEGARYLAKEIIGGVA